MAPTLGGRYVVTDAGCWEWIKPDTQRYGRLRYAGRNQLAHRVVWQIMVGPIPDGLVLDHLCRNTGCVNPAHLEPVTQEVNIKRGESSRIKAWRAGTCEKGHTNRYVNAAGKAVCRDCRNARKCG